MLFVNCHIVVLVVKIIYVAGIGNDVMDGVRLNDFKLRYIEIICILPKLNISFEYHRFFGISNVCIRWRHIHFS